MAVNRKKSKKKSRSKKKRLKPCKSHQYRNRSTNKCRNRSKKRSRKISKKRSKKRSRKISKKRSGSTYSGKNSNPINKYFSNIYIINLADQTNKFNKVKKRFIKKGLKYIRFPAIDGRCKGKKACDKKKKELEKKYKVKIAKKLNAPASSLTIGTIQILKEMVKHKWPRILICEDDIEFTKDMNKKFSQGIKEIKNINWDLIYLGCGNTCGYRGISDGKTSKNKYKTTLSIVGDEYDWYVQHKNDLRLPSDSEESERIGKNMSYAPIPGGTWCYGYSLSGAKKFLKYIKNKVSDHIDQIIIKAVDKDVLEAVAFDPPIVMHESGAFRVGSTIPWEW
jgi:GR25 family glycosyltransferase involved in LPS biosynthesis